MKKVCKSRERIMWSGVENGGKIKEAKKINLCVKSMFIVIKTFFRCELGCLCVSIGYRIFLL